MKYFEVGLIVSTHGIKGEVKVKSDTSFTNERYRINNILYLNYDNKMIPIEINSHRHHKGYDLITFNNLTNINDVLKYVNCRIYVNRDDLQELADDEFYYDDLIDLIAYDDQGDLLGKIIDINELPHGILLVLKKIDESEALIPFVEEFIKDIDLENKKIIIKPIEGLL